MTFLLAVLIQFLPGLPDPDAPVQVGGVVEGPYLFREDEALTTKVVLANGVTAIVRESNAANLTSLTMEVRAGYLDEAPGSGEARIVAEAFAEREEEQVRALGGTMAVDVDDDRSVFGILVPPESVVDALEWQARSLENPVFQEPAIRGVRDRLVAVDAREMDRPSDRVRQGLIELAFDGHPYGRSRILDGEFSGGLDVASFEAFFETHYAPENLTVVLIGPFVRERMLEEIVRTLGSLGSPESPDPAPPADDADSETDPDPVAGVVDQAVAGVPAGFRYDWVRGPLSRAHFGIAFRVPEASVAGTRERYVLETLLALLADGRASRLNVFVRDEQGVIDRVEGSYVELGTRRSPELLAMLTFASADLESAEVAFFTELERIRRFGVSEEEVARARVRVALSHYERRQTVSGLASDLALREFQGDWKLGERFPEGISQVTPLEVQAFLRENFREDNLVVFELLPGDSARTWTSAEFLTRIPGQVPGQMVSRSVEELEVTAGIPVEQTGMVVDIAHPITQRAIRRGPDVYIVEDHRLPLVSFGIFFPGGRVLESTENSGITELMLRSSLRGTRRFNGSEIARRLENAGARLDVVNEPDYFGYVLDGVSGDLEPALDVVMELWQEPAFLDDDVDFAKGMQRARMMDDAEEARARAVQHLLAAVFAGDPYSLPRNGTPESLENIDSESLEAWHFEHARAVMPVIVVAGDVNGSGIVSTIATTITNEDLFERDVASLPEPPPVGEYELPMTPDRSTYGVVAYGGTVGAFASPDRALLAVIRGLFDGRLGNLSRAFAEAGIGAVAEVGEDLRARSGALYVTAFHVEQSFERISGIIEAEFARLASGELEADELASAIARSDLAHRAEVEGPRRVVDAIGRSVLSGGGPEGVYGFSDAIRGVSAERLQSMAEEFVSSGDVRALEVGGR